MSYPQPVEKDLPIDLIIEDPNQPRESFNTDGDKNRLMLSLKDLGIQQPVAVLKIKGGNYQIIDGHRRIRCARELGMKKVPCRIYEKIDAGELERVRFELQNNRRLWKPLERASSIANFKKNSGIATNKEAAEKLFISETLLSNTLQLGKLKEEYKSLMAKYPRLGPSYQVEFVKLHPKLRPIKGLSKTDKEFTVDDIIKSLFERVQTTVIRSSKDFRKLGRIFLRATVNRKHIYDYLSNPDMTVDELEQVTIQSGFSLWLEQSITRVKTNIKNGDSFSHQEKILLMEMQRLLNDTLN